MFFTATQPDGSIEYIGPKEMAYAGVWGMFNKELDFLLRLMKSCDVGETFKFKEREFKRCK